MPLSFVARILRPVNSYYISLKRVDWKIKERLASTKLNHIFQMRYCNALFSLTYIYIYIYVTLVFLILAVGITESAQTEVEQNSTYLD